MKIMKESDLSLLIGGSETSDAIWWLIGTGIGLAKNAWLAIGSIDNHGKE